MIKSIETYYKGYLCRSRTEARWLVAFDKAGIQYEYEPEGFDLALVGKYLPDFYLPQVDMYAEVKGKKFTLKELKKARALADYEEKSVLLLDGAPSRKGYWAICPYNCWGAFEIKYEDEIFNILDFDIFEEHEYWLHEGRFFSATGTGMDSFPSSHSNGYSDESDSIAVRKSRSARFEHYRK
tara:strand:- start:920 stop:1465 length:546 start_codon:yes stop_codon:yes gene_type:complete